MSGLMPPLMRALIRQVKQGNPPEVRNNLPEVRTLQIVAATGFVRAWSCPAVR